MWRTWRMMMMKGDSLSYHGVSALLNIRHLSHRPTDSGMNTRLMRAKARSRG
jgi:hypothetical protein